MIVAVDALKSVIGTFETSCCQVHQSADDFILCLYRLRDDLRAQASELTTLQTRLKDSQLNLNEFQSNTLPTQYELTKTIHEKNLLTEQVKYLENELQMKAQDERTLRADSASKVDELDLALSEANAQVDMLTKQLAAAKVGSAFPYCLLFLYGIYNVD